MLSEFMTDLIKNELEKIINAMGFSASVETDEAYLDSIPRFNIMTEDAPFLIGGGGQTPFFLEHIAKKITQKKGPECANFVLDVNDYRLRRLEELREEVRKIAKRVRLYRKEIRLKPMSSFERRIIHMTLAEHPDIVTESVGQDPERKVVIKPFP